MTKMSRLGCKIIRSNKVRLLYKISNFRGLSTKNDPTSNQFDLVVVGGGIVGTATARELLYRLRNLRMAILEKESNLAKHQSGNNSGVIHAGIYYKPGSLKAKLCVEGLHLLYKYCDQNQIPYKKIGKLIVATNEIEVKRLLDLQNRGIQNEVPGLKLLENEESIKKIEPHCKGLKALWSPYTGIVDYVKVTQQYGKDFESYGGQILFNFKVNGFIESTNPDYPVMVSSKSGNTIETKYVLTCGGLQSDKISELSGCSKDPRIVPFRGEYLLLTPEKNNLINGNIYGVPDPKLPFLGVHFTPRMDGSVLLGPNAVLAFQREGYKWSDINWRELADALLYPGFRKMALKYTSFGFEEAVKSIYIKRRIKDLQRYIPEIQPGDVTRGPAGVRAQALDRNGNLLDDFYFDSGKGIFGSRILHCRNAPSPGATSSLAIARMVADKIWEKFKIDKI